MPHYITDLLGKRLRLPCTVGADALYYSSQVLGIHRLHKRRKVVCLFSDPAAEPQETARLLARMMALSSSAATFNVGLSFSLVRHCSIASFCRDFVSVGSVVVERCAVTPLVVAISNVDGTTFPGVKQRSGQQNLRAITTKSFKSRSAVAGPQRHLCH